MSVFSRNGINLRCKSGREDSRKRNGAIIEGGLKKREKEKKKMREKKNYRGRISSPFFIADAAHVGRLISSRDLPGRINSPADAGPWIFSRLGPFALGTERLDSVRDRKVNRSAPLNRVW